jgi:hypothetical protein
VEARTGAVRWDGIILERSTQNIPRRSYIAPVQL